MQISTIISTANQHVKAAIGLKQKKERQESGLFLIEGKKMLAEAACAGLQVKSIFVEEKKYQEDRIFYEGINPQELFLTTESVIARISDWKTPQGCVGVVEMQSHPLEEYLAKEQLFAVVLDGVADPGNIGTIVRTAEACGVDVVIAAKGTADCFQPKALRASMGSVFRVGIVEDLEALEIARLLKESGVKLIVTSLQGETANSIKAGSRFALVFGSEGAGVSDTFLQNGDILLRMPMAGKVESLNVAVSAGILMYKMFEAAERGQS